MFPQIRNMDRLDTDRVGEILYEGFTDVATKYGYAPAMNSVQEGKSWAWAMFHHGAGEGLVATVEDRVVGVVFLNRRGELTGAGPMAIERNFQGKTIAGMLMDTLIERAGNSSSLRCIQESFNTTSFAFQYAFGFSPVADLLDLILTGNPKQSVDLHGNVSELSAKDLDELCAYDLARSGFDRSKDLAYYARWGKVLVCRNQSRIRGYLACLPGSGSVQLGPLLAEDEDEAEHLFRHALAVFKGKTCRTRVMTRDFRFASAVMKLGFRLYCMSFLMVRGAWRPGKYVEAYGRFPEGV